MTAEEIFLRAIGVENLGAAPDKALAAAWELRTQVFRTRCERLHAEIAELSAWATQHQIPVMLIKGGALLLREYHGVLTRPISDLDVLVPATEAPRALALLQTAGFKRIVPHNRNRWHRQILDDAAAEGRMGLAPASGVPIDLHWHVSYWIDYRRIEISVEKLWDSAVPCGREKFLYLPNPDLHFTLLLLHSHEYGKPTPGQFLDLVLAHPRLEQPWGSGLTKEDRDYVSEYLKSTLESVETLVAEQMLDDRARSILRHPMRPHNPFWLNLRRGRFRSLPTLLRFCLGYLMPDPEFYQQHSTLGAWREHYANRFRLARPVKVADKEVREPTLGTPATAPSVR